MKSLIIKDKKGMETMAFILIALILAAIVLIALSGGLQMVVGKVKSAIGGSSNIDYIKGFCELSCNLGFKNDYCYKPRTLTDTLGNKLNDVTCYFLSKYKPIYETNSCPNQVCSVEFNNRINSAQDFKNLQCTRNKLYLQSFIQNSEKEFTLLTKGCSNYFEENPKNPENNLEQTNFDVIKKCADWGKIANLPTDPESDKRLDDFCNTKFDVIYDDTQYHDTTCYALSKKYSKDFIGSSTDLMQGDLNRVPGIVVDTCESKTNYVIFLDSTYESQLSIYYKEYLDCLSNSNGENCIYPLASKLYPICKEKNLDKHKQSIQFFNPNNDGSKSLITLPFKCGDYQNVDDSCLSFYNFLSISGYLTGGFCDKQINILDTNTGVYYKSATCFSILYNTVSDIYKKDIMNKCYSYQYLVFQQGDYKIYNRLTDLYKNFNSHTEDFNVKDIFCSDLSFYNGETIGPNLINFQFFFKSKEEANSYSLVKFPFSCIKY